MKINHRDISADALSQIIESFVQREGTDYGEREFSLAGKVAQVRAQLDAGQVHLVFDPESESVNLLTEEAFQSMAL